jgi:Mor family transcriptional regulator
MLRRKPASKLTEEQVKLIRARYTSGSTQSELAREYGISIGHIGRIVRGEVWTDRGQPSSEAREQAK